MKADPQLHHYCQNITGGRLQDIMEMYQLLGFDVVYKPDGDNRWIMVGQKQLRFAIQVAEVTDSPMPDINIKKQTHVAFISDDPQEVVRRIENWAKRKGFNFRKGGWSDRELFFDLSDIFVNFVVEVMHTSIESE